MVKSDYDEVEMGGPSRPWRGRRQRTLRQNSTILEHSTLLQSVFERSNLLSQAELQREVLRGKIILLSPQEWRQELSTLGVVENAVASEDMITFFDNTTEALVEDELAEHLKITLDWAEPKGLLNPDDGALINHKYLLRACEKGSWSVILVLLDHGFTIYSHLNDPEWSDMDELLELDYLLSESNPLYLLGVFQANALKDPVKRCFELIALSKELEQSMPAFQVRLSQHQRDVENFLVSFFQNINKTDKTAIFLSGEDGLDGYSLAEGHNSILARVQLGLSLEMKSFVSHDNCQQLISKHFVGRSSLRLASRRVDKWKWSLTQLFLSPVFSVAFLFRGCCSQKLSFFYNLAHNLESPCNSLVSHIMAQVVLMVLMIATQWHPLDHSGINPSPYQYLLLLYVFGFLFRDVKAMFHLSQSVRYKNGGIFRKSIKFFSSMTHNWRFLGHAMLLFGIILEPLGFYLESMSPSRDQKYLGCPSDMISTYGNYHVSRFGICLQAVAIVVIVCNTIHLFRLNPTLGALYLGIRKCFRIFCSFSVTFLLLTIAFGLGLHFILRHIPANCYSPVATDLNCGPHATENAPIMPKQSQFGITLTCLKPGNSSQRTQMCTPGCLEQWSQDPSQPQCPDGTTIQMVPPLAQKEEDLSILINLQSSGAKNHFHLLNSTGKMLIWSIFNPGDPGVVGCAQGVFLYTALTLWYLYCVIVVIVMLNLLIALMSSTMEMIEGEKVINWKFHRTQLWMEYCEISVSLPPPMNLLQLIYSFLTCITSACCLSACWPADEATRDRAMSSGLATDTIEYTDLVDILVEAYMKDFRSSDLQEVRKEDLERIIKEQEAISEKLVNFMSA